MNSLNKKAAAPIFVLLVIGFVIFLVLVNFASIRNRISSEGASGGGVQSLDITLTGAPSPSPAGRANVTAKVSPTSSSAVEQSVGSHVEVQTPSVNETAPPVPVATAMKSLELAPKPITAPSFGTKSVDESEASPTESPVPSLTPLPTPTMTRMSTPGSSPTSAPTR